MTTSDDTAGGRVPKQAPATSSAVIKRWMVADLLGGAREAQIQHGEEVYRLRLTANNKLILIK